MALCKSETPSPRVHQIDDVFSMHKCIHSVTNISNIKFAPSDSVVLVSLKT